VRLCPFLYVPVDRVEHLRDAPVAFTHIHRHRVAVEDGIESAQCAEEALRRFEGLRLDRESSHRYLVASNVPAGLSTLGLRLVGALDPHLAR
jgi:hypothetical protein